MATTILPAGSFSLGALFAHAFSGDTSGQRVASLNYSRSFAATEDLPLTIGISGFSSAAEVTCADGEWHLADPADPFQGMGNAVFNDGVSPVGKPLVALLVVSDSENEDSVTIRIPASNGCPVLNPAGAGYEIKPGSVFVFLDPTGTMVSSLARGTNDIIEIEVSTGAPVVQVIFVTG
jgi:hypothetical protein